MLEQGLARGGQLVALGMLHEQRGPQALLDALDMPGHGAVGSVQALGGGQQAAAALQLEEKPQIIPIEHACPLWQFVPASSRACPTGAVNTLKVT
ncbi:hypothetical protein D3C71_1895450 [compost metagenome]